MPAQDFGYAWRTVVLYCPAAPPFLAREWVNTAWKQLCRLRSWNFLQAEIRLSINPSRAIAACTVTTGSTTVTSAGLFLPADAGRQFETATYPVYTIVSVPDTSTIILDTPYGEGTNGAATATILDAYTTLPANFASFRLIADPPNQRRLAFWITQDQLNILDPTRQASDTGPHCLSARTPSTYPPTLGQTVYEYWPRPTALGSYPALVNLQASALTDSSVFAGVLQDGAEVIVKGALAQAAEWPGTADRPNPYFNLALAKAKQAEFLDGAQHLSLRDDERANDDLSTVHWERWPLADLAYNDQALRATDATIADLY